MDTAVGDFLVRFPDRAAAVEPLAGAIAAERGRLGGLPDPPGLEVDPPA